MKSTFIALVFATLFVLVGGRRIGEVEQEHGDLIEKPKRELDPAYYFGRASGYFGAFGGGDPDAYRLFDPEVNYQGFGGLGHYFRVIVACVDDDCIEHVRTVGVVHYEYRYIKAIAATLPLDEIFRLNIETNVE
jgi:hypothetical protein